MYENKYDKDLEAFELFLYWDFRNNENFIFYKKTRFLVFITHKILSGQTKSNPNIYEK